MTNTLAYGTVSDLHALKLSDWNSLQDNALELALPANLRLVYEWFKVIYPLAYYNAKFITTVKSLAVQPRAKENFFLKKIKPLFKAFRKHIKGLFTHNAISASDFIVIEYYF